MHAVRLTIAGDFFLSLSSPAAAAVSRWHLVQASALIQFDFPLPFFPAPCDCDVTSSSPRNQRQSNLLSLASFLSLLPSTRNGISGNRGSDSYTERGSQAGKLALKGRKGRSVSVPSSLSLPLNARLLCVCRLSPSAETDSSHSLSLCVCLRQRLLSLCFSLSLAVSPFLAILSPFLSHTRK